jgi:hypothetical protein
VNTRQIARAKAFPLLVSAWLLVSGCLSTPQAPRHTCPLRSLVLDASDFPNRIFVTGPSIHEPDSGGPRDSVGTSFYFRVGGGYQEIYRYASAGQALRMFRYGVANSLAFAPPQYGPVDEPAEIAYRSPLANQYRVGCAEQVRARRCHVIAQYDEFYVHLKFDVSPGSFEEADIDPVMRSFDRRMMGCLEQEVRQVP